MESPSVDKVRLFQANTKFELSNSFHPIHDSTLHENIFDIFPHINVGAETFWLAISKGQEK